MARLKPSRRYQPVQPFTVARLAVCATAGAVSAWAYLSHPVTGYEFPAAVATPTANTSAPTMQEWLAQSEPTIHDLIAARNDLATAAGNRDVAKTGAACQTTTDALATLRKQLPSPDPALNTTLQQAINSYQQGLPSCVVGAQNEDGEGLHRAATSITQGDAAMQSALDIVRDNKPRNMGVLFV